MNVSQRSGVGIGARSPEQRGPRVAGAGPVVPIGVRPDGAPAPLSPAAGPLLILGGVSSGKTLVVKKLLKRAAVADPEAALFATDAASPNTGYDELARVLGLSHAYIDGSDESGPVSAPRRLVVSGGPTARGRSLAPLLDRRLDDLLRSHASGGPPPHLFLDGAEELLAHELASSLWRWAWERGARYGLLAVAAVGDAARFLDGRVGPILARHAGTVLFLRHSPEEARRTVRALASARLGLRNVPRTRRLTDVPVGRGLLLRAATGQVEDLDVDLTDEELAFFDTRPIQDPRRDLPRGWV